MFLLYCWMFKCELLSICYAVAFISPVHRTGIFFLIGDEVPTNLQLITDFIKHERISIYYFLNNWKDAFFL